MREDDAILASHAVASYCQCSERPLGLLSSAVISNSAILRFVGKTGKTERYAGPGKPYTDGTGLLDSGFHTVFATYSRDASLIFVGGGDEFSCRRLWRGKVQHLQKDGTWKSQQNDKGNAWQFGGSGLHLGRDGKLYTVPPPYGWPAWVIRATFGKD